MDVLRAGCKVNLGLRIVGVRPNGYHELDSLFWPLAEPHDTLTLRPAGTPGLTVRCAAPDVDPERNTLTKAWAALAAAAGPLPGLDVELRKGIPSGAGLGGGSSDAAALLLWANVRLARPLSAEALADVALAAGADTPFFLRNGPCRVRGIGEQLLPVSPKCLSGLGLLLVFPGVHASTPQAYADYDAARRSAEGLTKTATTTKEFFPSGGRFLPDLHNDLEEVVFARHARIADVKATLLRLGADAAAMSGSGSSVVALFPDGAAALRAQTALAERPWRTYAQTL